MQMTPSRQEIAARRERLYQALSANGQDWDAALIVDKISQYYFTGTMQDGLFVLRNDGEGAYFVRRSYARAKDEGLIDEIYPMSSYKEMLSFLSPKPGRVYLDINVATLAHLQRLEKYFTIGQILPLDPIVQCLRSSKSPYELAMIAEAARQHDYLLHTLAPSLLKEGMNEAELTASLYQEMISLGYQGISRFGSFQAEMVVGQLGFGDNSIYPTSFDGPGGMKGMSAAVPFVGDRERKLRRGDLIFIDIGYGYSGYHSDCTQIYMFGAEPTKEVAAMHHQCLEIERQAAAMLKPGAIPEDIYNTIISSLDAEFLTNFMGYKDGSVRFLGHGIGLQIDEYPVLARGFRQPLEKNMVIALEPKKSIPGIGLVGVEDTYLVSEAGGICITNGEREIMVV